MTPIRILLLAIAALGAVPAAPRGQANARRPHIAYLYPGGGKKGTTFYVTVGGQYLRDAKRVYVTGDGVRATVVRYMRPVRNLNGDQQALLRKRLKEVTEERLAEARARRPAAEGQAPKKRGAGAAPPAKEKPKKKSPSGKKGKKAAPPPPAVRLPDAPVFHGLDRMSLAQLRHVVASLEQVRGRQQINRQLSEALLIRVAIDADAPSEDRELRIATTYGLTNPALLKIGVFPEIRELEPNDRRTTELVRYHRFLRDLPALSKWSQPRPHRLPVVLNGQILPGDVDRFRFRARAGQSLVIEAQARRLIPYLADAVPGWFQATLALYDAQGNEVAYRDGYRFHPDPVLFCRIEREGDYELEIRDAIYRGRMDFVYRISVAERPFITRMFPLGGKAGVATKATVQGWNLPETPLPLDTTPGDPGIRRTRLARDGEVSNSVAYAVDSLPEAQEREPNEAIRIAQPLETPVIVNGRIGRPGDMDVFQIKGIRSGKLVVEVQGRRLDSPLDSLVQVTDASGRVVAWNDDHVEKDGHLHKDPLGLITHHADSYLIAELPRSGAYYVHLSDTQRQGSKAHAYRLRISRPRPDFALRMTPSSLAMRGGSMMPIHVHVLRKDGFDGPIRVALTRDLGFELVGGRIPAGCDHVRMSLKAPRRVEGSPVALELEGRARIGSRTVRHRVHPAEDRMQAFLYRHLVPAQELRVAVAPERHRLPKVTVTSRLPIRIPVGGKARVRIKGLRGLVPEETELVLNDPPGGVALDRVSVGNSRLTFWVKAGSGKRAVAPGFQGSLVVDVHRVYTPRGKDGKPTGPQRRVTVGTLPAIPIRIVARRR